MGQGSGSPDTAARRPLSVQVPHAAGHSVRTINELRRSYPAGKLHGQAEAQGQGQGQSQSQGQGQGQSQAWPPRQGGCRGRVRAAAGAGAEAGMVTHLLQSSEKRSGQPSFLASQAQLSSEAGQPSSRQGTGERSTHGTTTSMSQWALARREQLRERAFFGLRRGLDNGQTTVGNAHRRGTALRGGQAGEWPRRWASHGPSRWSGTWAKLWASRASQVSAMSTGTDTKANTAEPVRAPSGLLE